jgi:hypothetical protein
MFWVVQKPGKAVQVENVDWHCVGLYMCVHTPRRKDLSFWTMKQQTKNLLPIPLPALLAVCFATLPQDSTCDQYKAISHHTVASKAKEAERGCLLSSEMRLWLIIRAIEGPQAATQRLDPES